MAAFIKSVSLELYSLVSRFPELRIQGTDVVCQYTNNKKVTHDQACTVV